MHENALEPASHVASKWELPLRLPDQAQILDNSLKLLCSDLVLGNRMNRPRYFEIWLQWYHRYVRTNPNHLFLIYYLRRCLSLIIWSSERERDTWSKSLSVPRMKNRRHWVFRCIPVHQTMTWPSRKTPSNLQPILLPHFARGRPTMTEIFLTSSRDWPKRIELAWKCTPSDTWTFWEHPRIRKMISSANTHKSSMQESSSAIMSRLEITQITWSRSRSISIYQWFHTWARYPWTISFKPFISCMTWRPNITSLHNLQSNMHIDMAFMHCKR